MDAIRIPSIIAITIIVSSCCFPNGNHDSISTFSKSDLDFFIDTLQQSYVMENAMGVKQEFQIDNEIAPFYKLNYLEDRCSTISSEQLKIAYSSENENHFISLHSLDLFK